MERDEIRAIILLALSISTHTLTWSVTGDIGAVFGDYKDFNSHAHVERDQYAYRTAECCDEFQLTRSRGA